jgi:hypothetical protein
MRVFAMIAQRADELARPRYHCKIQQLALLDGVKAGEINKK